MSLFDLAGQSRVETIPFPTDQDGLLPYIVRRQPLLLSGVRESLPFTRDWNYEFLKIPLKRFAYSENPKTVCTIILALNASL